MEPLLRASHLSKSFGALSAIQGVDLEIYPGEVVGLAGESGSGKSVLCMLLAGFVVPTEGRIDFAGHPLRRPLHARALGIEVILETPSLADDLDVSGNIFLGSESSWPSILKWFQVPNRQRMDQEAARILQQLELDIPLHKKAAHLSSEQRQWVAIARTLARPARLVIVDDPTMLLSYPSQQKLLSLIQRWQVQGTAVLLSSNNLDHLLAVTDRIIVLRHGRPAAEYRTDEVDREEIVAAMIGLPDRQQLTPIIWALDSYYRAREQAEKLRYDEAMLEKDLVAPEGMNRQLIDNLAAQIDALDSANVALQDAQRRLLTELEQERKHLAREIHDQVIQDLLSVNYQLEEVSVDEVLTPALQRELGETRDSIRDLVSDLRQICGHLRPPTIDSLGLGAALRSYLDDWTRRTGIAVRLELDPQLGRLPEAIELSIFRIVQEGLSNVRKHAQATAVEVVLTNTSLRTLMLSIADNGVGLDEGFDLVKLRATGSYGLLGVSERVALLSGRLKLQNQAAGGLLIQAEIPHPRAASPGESSPAGSPP